MMNEEEDLEMNEEEDLEGNEGGEGLETIEKEPTEKEAVESESKTAEEENRGTEEPTEEKVAEADDNEKEISPSRFAMSMPELSAAELPVVIYFLASFLFFCVALADRNDLPTSILAYGLCVGIIGMLLAGGLIGWMRGGSEGSLEKYGKFYHAVLFLWSIIGWGIFTFDYYRFVGNGFFSLWIMLICSVWVSGIMPGSFANTLEAPDMCIYGLLLCSVIVIIAMTTYSLGFPSLANFYPVSYYTLVVCVLAMTYGVITGVFALVKNDKLLIPSNIQLWILVSFLVLTLLSAFLMTLIGPFESVGNGYLGVWGSAVFTGLAIGAVRKEQSPHQEFCEDESELCA